MTTKPVYTGNARFYPKSMGTIWSGTEGVLQADNNGLAFKDESGAQLAAISFHEIKKIKFDFGKRDYLRITKTDGSGCFFILEALGTPDVRTEQYRVLEQILTQNGFDVKINLQRTAKFQKAFQSFNEVFYVLLAIAFVAIATFAIASGQIKGAYLLIVLPCMAVIVVRIGLIIRSKFN
jgi:hypothetical protein